MSTKTEDSNSSIDTFALSKSNYQFMLIGIGVVVLGYILMIGGGSEDPNEFDEAIFSFRRITLAPIVCILGYGIIFYSIFKKGK